MAQAQLMAVSKLKSSHSCSTEAVTQYQRESPVAALCMCACMHSWDTRECTQADICVHKCIHMSVACVRACVRACIHDVHRKI